MFQKQLNLIVLILLIINFFTACVKDKPNPPNINITSGNGSLVYVLNEGAMGMNNSGISVMNADSALINNKVFEQSNGFSLGDVANDFQQYQNRFYVVLNNSGFVRVLDTANVKEVGRINGLSFPRRFLGINANKAYVSHLYRPYISVVDLSTQQIIKTIPSNYPNTEDMVAYKQYVYVSNWDTASPYLYKINTLNDSVEATINLQVRAPHSMVMAGEQLWVLAGNPYKGTPSHLVCIDANTDTLLKTMAFPAQADPIRLTCNKAGDTLYFLMVNYNGGSNWNGLYKMPTTAQQLPTLAWIPAPTGTYYWAYGIHPSNGRVFLSDPKGFTQQSTLEIRSAQGQLLHQVRGGIGANHFYFKP